MLACAFKHDDRASILRLLINAKAAVNYQSRADGKTALHVAAKHGALDCVQILLKSDADPTIADSKGKCLLLSKNETVKISRTLFSNHYYFLNAIFGMVFKQGII